MAEVIPGADRRPLTTFNYVSYGAPAAPLALAGLPLAVYLPVIYADSDGFGLSLATVGLLIGLSRFTDVFTDPLIGYLSDKWKTRWGRRKPWVLAGTPIFALGMWFMFMPPFEFSEVTVFGATFSNGYLWLVAMLTLFFVGSTIKDLPFSAWGAELSSNYHERTLIMSWKEGVQRRRIAGVVVHSSRRAVLRPSQAQRRRVHPRPGHVHRDADPESQLPDRGARMARRGTQGADRPDRGSQGRRQEQALRDPGRRVRVRRDRIRDDQQPVALLRQARHAGRRTLRGLPRALLRLPGRRHSPVVQAVAAHRQAQGHDVGRRLVRPVVVLHPAHHGRALGVVRHLRGAALHRLHDDGVPSHRRDLPGRRRNRQAARVSSWSCA